MSSESTPLVMDWRGPVAQFLTCAMRHVDLEGAIRSGKTTVALWKVLNSVVTHPGVAWLICRYSDEDTRTKLRPVWERIAVEAGVPMVWQSTYKYYDVGNGSRVYCFGLKAQDLTLRYAKFRGVTLAGIYNDQTEELPFDIYEEMCGRLSQPGFPQQILITPNPPDEDHWISQRFPVENTIAGHQYYRVSVYDNAHNLPAETIAGLESTYPVGHVKHNPMLLGLRGMNVVGRPVYGALDPRDPASAAFQRARHERPLALDPDLPLLESLDFGKHHPCVVWAQFTPHAELFVLGGVLGHNLDLETFAPIVQQYRQTWFPEALEIRTCCDPAGRHANSQGLRANALSVLEDLGFSVVAMDDSNSPAVRLAMIERLNGQMRRRSPRGEAFGVDDAHWVRISATAVTPHRFVTDACEAGYVWDNHFISVGSKQIRRPVKDGWYEHGMNALEYLVHNFGGIQPTAEQVARHADAVRRRGRDVDIAEADFLRTLRKYGISPTGRSTQGSRGGYR